MSATLLREAMSDLHAPLEELGRRWAASPHRPRVRPETLRAWDTALDEWVASGLPLVLREGRRRSEMVAHYSGRQLIFGDNTPANWAFELALRDQVPDLSVLTIDNFGQRVPLSFVAQGESGKRNLNKAGWKVCHIEPVSDRVRVPFEAAPMERVEAAFRRFIHPRNIFLIPKEIAGAGEVPEVISAIVRFEKTSSAALK